MISSKVTELALEKIKELDYFLVDVKISATNEITVLFDKNDGVVIDDCLKVTDISSQIWIEILKIIN